MYTTMYIYIYTRLVCTQFVVKSSFRGNYSAAPASTPVFLLRTSGTSCSALPPFPFRTLDANFFALVFVCGCIYVEIVNMLCGSRRVCF